MEGESWVWGGTEEDEVGEWAGGEVWVSCRVEEEGWRVVTSGWATVPVTWEHKGRGWGMPRGLLPASLDRSECLCVCVGRLSA